ncbi:MFS transporter [Jidongwangia harbinensis]|uniref:MFS transporter n=1 Tax=Jidongwangia harbinensis TaxID=2878561 RepID=UPI001CD92EA2|nr:MFS transporter [Jidongwangia harbinensis]MCA2212869.1 MFS transporter [Jidongwangia harbinensis]
MIRETLAPLRLAGFRMLLAGRTINAFGNAFAPLALAFAVLDLTGSATDLGVVVGARTLVNVVFLLFGGALADRLPKNLLMVGSALAAAVTQGIVATLVLTDTATVPLLLGFGAVNGMVSALSMPASSAIVPQLVPADLRQQANGLGRLAFNGAAIIGAPIGGVVVASVGPGWGIVVDAATFLLAALCFALVRIPATTAPPSTTPPATTAPPPTTPPAATEADQPAGALIGAEQTAGEPVAPPPARPNILTDLRTGWSEFIARTWLWVVVAGFCVVNAALSGGFMVLGPVIADQTFGRQAWGFVLAAETAGMIIGAVLAMRVRLRRLLFFGVVCTAFEALPLLTLGVFPHVGVMLAAGFIAGLAIEQFGIAWETTMQEHVPADKLARVYSYDMVGSFVAIPVGQTLAGPVAEAVGVEATLIGAAALIVLAVLGMLTSRDVRHLRHRLPSKDPAAMEELPA